MNLKAELQTMSITDLRAVCRDLGVSCPKTKSGIIKRLLFPLKKEYKVYGKRFVNYLTNLKRAEKTAAIKKANILKFKRRSKYEDRRYDKKRKIKIKNFIMEELRNPEYTNYSRILEFLLNKLRNLGFKVYQDEYDSKFTDRDITLIGQIMKKIQENEKRNIREENEQKREEYMIKRIELKLDMRQQLKYIKQQVIASGSFRKFPRCEVYVDSIKLLEDLKNECRIYNLREYINKINYLIDTYKTNIKNRNCSY